MDGPDMDVGPTLPRYAMKGIDAGYKLGGMAGAAWGGYSGYAFMQHAAEGMHWSTQIVPYTYNMAEGATVGILLGAAAGAVAGGMAGTGAGAMHRLGEEAYDAVLRDAVEEYGVDEALDGAYAEAVDALSGVVDRGRGVLERRK